MAVSIQDSPIFPDISHIVYTNYEEKYDRAIKLECRLHTEERDLSHIDSLSVVGMNISRDYISNISDYIEIQMMVLPGTFVFDIKPFLTNCEITVYLVKQMRNGGKAVISKERYKAVYLQDKNDALPHYEDADRLTLDQSMPIVITFQLLDRSAETLRIKTVQGSYGKSVNPDNDTTPELLLKSIISEHATRVLIESKPAIDLVSIEEASNKTPLTSFTLGSGTRLIDVPGIMQKDSDGLYAAGLGSYIQKYSSSRELPKKVYFVYSLFNGSKYETQDRKIIFYLPNTSALSNEEVTYLLEDETLKVLTHRPEAIQNFEDSLVMSEGSGYRSVSGHSQTKKQVVLTPEGPSFSRTANVTEVVNRERDDGLNYAPYKGIISNQFEAGSEVLGREGSYIVLRVSHLDPDFIYPAAACKIVYEGKEESIVEKFGVIHRVRIGYNLPNMNIFSHFQEPFIDFDCLTEIEVFITH